MGHIVLKQLRILYLTQFFSSDHGGGPLIFYDLAKALSQRGHKMFVICNFASESIFDENINVFMVEPLLKDTYGLPSSLLGNMRFIINSVLLGRRLIRRYEIDLIHTNSFTPVISGSILSKISRIPMVGTIHDVFTDEDRSNWKRWVTYSNLPHFYSTIGRIYEGISLRMPCNAIHAVSNATKNDILLHKRRRDVRVIYPGIDRSAYNPNGISYRRFILFIGRLVFYKNVDLLIRAYQEVIKEVPLSKLVIAGVGPMELEWKKLAKSLGLSANVIFLGLVTHQEKIKLLRECAALALPSSFEGFGLVILESFAMRKPVLVSKIPPFDEIVTQNVDGYLLEYNDVRQWADAAVSLLKDKELCRKMGDNAAKKIERFDFNKYVDSIESLYEGISDA